MNMTRQYRSAIVRSSLLALCAAALTHPVQASTQWGVAINVPIQVGVPAPQAFPMQPPVYSSGPAPAPAPIVPEAPSIEALQMQQQARIEWAYRSGFLAVHDLRRLQSQQAGIEQQRYWAYADGWLSPEEQQALYSSLNGLSQNIEYAIARPRPNYYAPAVYVGAPPPLVIWQWSWWQRPSHGHGHGYGHGGAHQQGQQIAPPAGGSHSVAYAAPKPRPQAVDAVPVSPMVKPRLDHFK